MNNQKSWDASLIKKFSSSNHFKLLNQLRNEVKKYPLIKKKNSTTNIKKDINYDSKDTQNHSISNDLSKGINNTNNKELHSNQSTVSFNNSKNFSIYKTVNEGTSENKKESNSSSENNSKEKSNSSKSFKDRLNGIDMK